jgi:L-amino acid N-acyltransferase YncA
MKIKRKVEKPARATAVATEAQEEPLREEPPNAHKVQFPCHLRPATKSDIKAITDIYNQEVAEGYKVMDTNPLNQDDFYNIYSQCLTEEMPFVVAVEGWHGKIAEPHEVIIGFALVTAVNRGISGSYKTLSRIGGKLLVIVKTGYRRKKIGTALIDILITNCTGWYISKRGYQFVNSTHDWMSTEFGSNPRKWWYLEMEVMIRSGANEEMTRKGEEFQLIWNFLESKFDLLLKHYDEKCFYDPRRMNWLDKLTFRRVCRTLGEL